MIALAYVILRTTRLEELREFYERVFDVSFVLEQHGDGPQHYSLQLEGVVLELYPTKKEKGSSEGLGFVVDDLARLCERIDPKYICKDRQETGRGRLIGLKDPDGRKVYVEEIEKVLLSSHP